MINVTTCLLGHTRTTLFTNYEDIATTVNTATRRSRGDIPICHVTFSCIQGSKVVILCIEYLEIWNLISYTDSSLPNKCDVFTNLVDCERLTFLFCFLGTIEIWDKLV